MSILKAKAFDKQNEKDKEYARILVRNVYMDILDAQEYAGTAKNFKFNIMKEEYEYFEKIKENIDSFAKIFNLSFTFEMSNSSYYMIVENKN